jgi:hypothetical protein
MRRHPLKYTISSRSHDCAVDPSQEEYEELEQQGKVIVACWATDRQMHNVFVL